jgi:hypothetical protein
VIQEPASTQVLEIARQKRDEIQPEFYYADATYSKVKLSH